MPGSPTTPGRPSACVGALGHIAFHYTDSVGTRNQFSIAAQWLACTFPYRRFADILTDACARLGADVVRYSFIVVDLHHLLLAGLPAHLVQKLRRSMVDPEREPLEGVVEVDQAEIPFRADDTFFNPVKSGKILIAGAVEVIDRGANQAKPRRKAAKYLDTRSGRIRLAAIPDNSAASLEAFVRANVKPGTTLLTDGHRSYPGLTDYRHDPRTVGKMAGHVVLPWIHRVFALMKRWGLGTYHGLRRKHIDTYLNEFVFRYNRRFYRHVSFETVLGLASHHQPTSYWDIIGRDNPRKGMTTVRHRPRRRKTATGIRQDGVSQPIT